VQERKKKLMEERGLVLGTSGSAAQESTWPRGIQKSTWC